jgi:rhodanese-related sulfurtransferase
VVREISVEDLKARRDRGEKPVVLDVREEWELQLARLPDVVHLPMNQVPGRLAELSRDAETVVMCHAGARSLRVAHFLVAQGFTNVANLTGGIAAWTDRVDATVPHY